MTVTLHDTTRLFIQALFTRRFLSERVAQMLYRKCCETVNSLLPEDEQSPYNPDNFIRLIGAINAKFDALDLKLIHAPDEATGRMMICVSNLKSDDLAQLATEYTAAEIAFYKAIIEEIATSPNETFSVTSMIALRQLAKAKVGAGKDKMTRAHGEVLLESFVANGWLAKSAQGRYTLGIRARFELLEYLTKNFEELEGKEHICSSCDQLVLSGVRCPKDECGFRIHRCCLNKARKRIRLCPTCGYDWSNATMRVIGEGAEQAEGSDRRRARRANQNDDEEEEEEERPRRVARKGGRRVEEEDEDDDEGGGTQMEVDQEETEARRPSRRR